MQAVTRVLRIAGSVALLLALSFQVLAQEFPARFIRVVVPYAPGGVADIRARMFARKMSDSLGQAVIVENKPGASGTVGAEFVARSPADGYVLLFGDVNTQALVPAMGGQHGYDSEKDFAAVGFATAGYPVLVASGTLGINSVAELTALIKTNPGRFNFASPGATTLQHFMAGYFAKQMDLKMTLVPYKGSAPAYPDLIAGHVQLILGYTPEFVQFVKSGGVKPLAVFGPRRIPLLGDVPTMAEAGFPGYEVHGWTGFFAPANTPLSVLQRLNAEIAKAGTSPEIQKSLAETGGEFIAMTPAEFGEFSRSQIKKWAKIVKESGVKIE